MKYNLVAIFFVIAISGCLQSEQLQTDNMSEYKTKDISIKWFGHSSFIIEGNKTIYFDPFVLESNSKIADFILITHDHFDHCSPEKVREIQSNKTTRIISTIDCVKKLTGRTFSIRSGDYFFFEPDDLNVTAYPAYNIEKPYHPKDRGVGLLVEINGTKIYHAGDTDNIDEFQNLTEQQIDVLMIPVGGKYTMNVTEAAEAAKKIKPKIVMPMHYNSNEYGIDDVEADAQEFRRLLNNSGVEVVLLKPIA